MTTELLIAAVSELIEKGNINKELGQELIQALHAPKIFVPSGSAQELVDGEVGAVQVKLSEEEIKAVMFEMTIKKHKSRTLKLAADSDQKDEFVKSLIGIEKTFDEEIDFNQKNKAGETSENELGLTQNVIINIPVPQYGIGEVRFGEIPEIKIIGQVNKQITLSFVDNNNGVILANIVNVETLDAN